MTNIIETIANRSNAFVPSTPREYLAVQLARKLNDVEAARHYAVLFEHYPEDVLLRIYRRCRSEAGLSGAEFMRKFRALTMSSDEGSTGFDYSLQA